MEEIGVGLELNEPAGLGTAEVSVDSVLGLEEPLEDTIGLELEQPIALNAGEDAVASALSLENPRSEVEEVGAGLELDESDEIENSDPQLAEPTDLELPPTKRACDEDLSHVEVISAREPASSRASLRGITSGTRVSEAATQIGTCWVFVDTNLDALLGALQSRTLSVTRVFVKEASADMLALISQLVPPSMTVSPWPLELPLSCAPCTIALTSYRVALAFCSLLASAGVVAILATKSYRKPSPPWRITTLPTDHPSLGGVTGTKGRLHLFTLVSSWSKSDLLPWPSAVERDLSTLLSYGEAVLTSAPPPAIQKVVPLRAHQTMTDPTSGGPVYHSCALHPPPPPLSTLVHAPTGPTLPRILHQ